MSEQLKKIKQLVELRAKARLIFLSCSLIAYKCFYDFA